MNWQIWTSPLVTLATQTAIAAYIYGRLAERVRNHGERLNKQDVRLDRHEERLEEHAVRIGKLEK